MTTHLELPYGKEKISLDLPPIWDADVFKPNPVPVAADPRMEILRSFENPLGGGRLRDFQGIRSVAIAISDETRLVPNHLILPPPA